MAKVNIVKEHFTSIRDMLSVINSRENNSVMKNEYSSSKGSYEFTGTRNWQEAIDLFENGYTDVLDKIKAGVAKGIKQTENIQKRRTSTGVVGYAPHVPNAIMGLPNSMIYTQSIAQKVKAISIVYAITENCSTDAEEFIESGIAVLNVINRLELAGYRVNLKIMFYCAECGSDRAFGTVDVKSYREHLDLKKICFPVAHPSMFRRLGFKWLETCKGLNASDWRYGYGMQIRNAINDKFVNVMLAKNEFFMNLETTRSHNYNVDEIIESLNLK